MNALYPKLSLLWLPEPPLLLLWPHLIASCFSHWSSFGSSKNSPLITSGYVHSQFLPLTGNSLSSISLKFIFISLCVTYSEKSSLTTTWHREYHLAQRMVWRDIPQGSMKRKAWKIFNSFLIYLLVFCLLCSAYFKFN